MDKANIVHHIVHQVIIVMPLVVDFRWDIDPGHVQELVVLVILLHQHPAVVRPQLEILYRHTDVLDGWIDGIGLNQDRVCIAHLFFYSCQEEMRWVFLFFVGMVSSLEMRCTSLFGLETNLANTDCSWTYPSSFYMDQLGEKGFNWVRIPFSGEYIRHGDFHILDDLFRSAEKWNMSILLDWHRNINAYQDNWLENISREDYLSLYKQLLTRYKDNPHLQMVGLFNEYKGQDLPYWKAQMEGVVRDLETTFPNRFLWLLGGMLWSGNHHDLDWSHLPFADRIYQDIHKYSFSGKATEDDWEMSFPKDRNHTIVGEWGYFSNHPDQVEWAHRFVEWLKKKHIRNTCFWVSVSNSGDTGGLWKDCKDFEYAKYDLLRSLWYDDRHLQVYNDTDGNPPPLVIVFSQKLRGGY